MERPVALGLPRGGVPVAAEVARVLDCPLDVLVVRKLGTPGRPELALGAVGEGDVRVLNRDLIDRLSGVEAALATVEAREREEIARRAQRYRADRNRIDLAGRTALVIDDGIATGASALAGCEIARRQGATRVVLAVPVAPYDFTPGDAADEYVAVVRARNMRAVGQWYEDFSQTTDEAVAALLSGHG